VILTDYNIYVIAQRTFIEMYILYLTRKARNASKYKLVDIELFAASRKSNRAD